ncbi:MAG TPA: hypothetical protein VIK54_06785 [Acidimicrobiia bacterium]
MGEVGAASTGRVRAVVTFVGDSNLIVGSAPVGLAFTAGDQPYAMVQLAKPRAAIRCGDVASPQGDTHDFWLHRLRDAQSKIATDGYVVNLGINDTGLPGVATGPGYSAYGEKIDWLMALLASRPVWWTNLPAEIEPPHLKTGCLAVNSALRAAEKRWPNLTVLDWAAVANPHPEYVAGQYGIHITWTGAMAWAQLVLSALDSYFPSVTAR